MSYTCSARGCSVVVLEGVVLRPCVGCDAVVHANLTVVLTGEAQVNNDDKQHQEPSAE
jgi:hypothetical protein